MMIALRAKDKIGYMNGKCAAPEEDSSNFKKWQCVDSMVLAWILNFISKEIVEAFLYATTAQKLWMELEQRFGKSNGLLLYQIKREINAFSQGNLTLMVYFTKLKKLWDELSWLKTFPTCSCGDAMSVADIENEDMKIN